MRRDPLAIILTVLVAISLVAAVFLLSRGFPDGEATEISIPVTDLPGIGEGTMEGEDIIITVPGGVSAEEWQDLAGALAAVITALTGLFGLVATQVWRRREEERTDRSHAVALEKERLALERERLELERERLELSRQREALQAGGTTGL